MSSKRKNNNKNQSKSQANDASDSNKQSKSTPKAKKAPKVFKYSFNDLPIDIMNAVIDFMTTPTFLQFRLVSKKWMRLCWKGRRTLDLTYISAAKLPKSKQLKQFFEKAHGLRSLKTHLNITGTDLAEVLDLEHACMSLTSISFDTKLQNCNEESFLMSIKEHLTRFVEINVRHIISPSRSFIGFTHLTQLQSLELGNLRPEHCFGLANLKKLTLHTPVYESAAGWKLVLQSATKLESFSININGDYWHELDIPSLTTLRQLKILSAHPKLSVHQLKLIEIISKLTNLEVIQYPKINAYHFTYYGHNSEDWECTKAVFPASIKKIKNFHTRSFAGIHSCLNLESLSVVAYPKNENFEELNGLAKLQELFVIPITLRGSSSPNASLTDEAINHLKHATGLHTLSFGLGWGAFTNLADIAQFKHLRHLTLNGYSLTSQAITNIAQCKQLFSLGISSMRDVNAMTFKPLTRLKYLTVLMLHKIEDLNERTTKQLDELTQLHDLRLTGCKNVNDQAIMNMNTIIQSHLLYLDVTETSIGAKGRQFVHHLLRPSKREHLWWFENLPEQ